MSRNAVLVAMLLAATAAAYFFVVPFARHYAAQQLGWNEAGQNALAKAAFFPILLLCVFVLKKLGERRQGRSSRTDQG